MSIADKLQTIAENEQRVFDAGKKSQYDEFWDALQSNGNRTDYYYGFCGFSWTAQTFKPKYDIKGTRFQNTFFVTNLLYGSLIDILTECGVIIDTSKATQINNMFGYSGVSDVPHIDLSGLTTYGVGDMFNQCTRLKKIEKLTLKEGVSFGTNAFNACKELEKIEFAGVLSTNGLNLQWSTKLNKASWTSLINALSSTTTGLTVTGSLASVNKAFEVHEGSNDGSTSPEWEILLNTKPNWTVTLV